MKTKLDYIKELKIGEDIKTDISDIVRLQNHEKGDMIMMGSFDKGKIWRIVEGKVKVTLYMENGGEYHAEFVKGEWIGIASCLIDAEGSVDVEAINDTKLLMIPLKDVIKSKPEVMPILWENVAIGSANEFMKFLGGSLARAVLSNEGYFLSHLERNNYEINFSNTRELSEILNTNLRTLQRIIKKMKEMGIIEKTRNQIKVINMKKFEELKLEQEEKY